MAHTATPGHPLTGTSTAAIFDYLSRISPNSITNRSPRDAWRSYLQGAVSGGGDKIKDLEYAFLLQRIGVLGTTVPAGTSLSDLWGIYLSAKGMTGDIVDKFGQWLDHGTA